MGPDRDTKRIEGDAEGEEAEGGEGLAARVCPGLDGGPAFGAGAARPPAPPLGAPPRGANPPLGAPPGAPPLGGPPRGATPPLGAPPPGAPPLGGPPRGATPPLGPVGAAALLSAGPPRVGGREVEAAGPKGSAPHAAAGRGAEEDATETGAIDLETSLGAAAEAAAGAEEEDPETGSSGKTPFLIMSLRERTMSLKRGRSLGS